MLRAVADTHTVVWYLYDDARLSERARTLIDEVASVGDQIGFSAITLAEVVYLSEKGRIHQEALGRMLTVLDEPRAVLRDLPLDRGVVAVMPSVDRTEVPDLPDRIIAATARLYGGAGNQPGPSDSPVQRRVDLVKGRQFQPVVREQNGAPGGIQTRDTEFRKLAF